MRTSAVLALAGVALVVIGVGYADRSWGWTYALAVLGAVMRGWRRATQRSTEPDWRAGTKVSIRAPLVDHQLDGSRRQPLGRSHVAEEQTLPQQ